ncbi:MAG: hypothetical protein AAGK32_05825, partial [Actinomycetota bacterium]
MTSGRRRRRPVRWAAAVGAVLLGLAACGSAPAPGGTAARDQPGVHEEDSTMAGAATDDERTNGRPVDQAPRPPGDANPAGGSARDGAPGSSAATGPGTGTGASTD